jgi:hypothetical protein
MNRGSDGGDISRDGRSYALSVLKADHAKIKRMFAEFAAAEGENERRELARIISAELTVDSAIEEEIVYPSEFDGEDADDRAALEFEAAKYFTARI